MSTPSSLGLQIGIVSTVRNGLSENGREIKEKEDVSRKSKLASRHEDGKNVSSKKLQIKNNPDNSICNVLKYKVVLIEV